MAQYLRIGDQLAVGSLGAVQGWVKVKVLDGQGKPYPGLEVNAYSRVSGGGFPPVVTDEGGVATFLMPAGIDVVVQPSAPFGYKPYPAERTVTSVPEGKDHPEGMPEFTILSKGFLATWGPLALGAAVAYGAWQVYQNLVSDKGAAE